MAVRTVVVRYAADMNDLIRGLDTAAKSNAKLANESEKTGKRVDAMAATGVGLGLALGVAVSRFAEFDAAMSAVAANTGATSDELNSLRDAAIKTGAATQFTATEAAQGINELAKAGVSADQILRGGLTGSLSLAAAGQIEVKDAAEIAATAMKQFNLQGDQVGHVADLLAAGANKAQGGVDDLGMALKQGGLVAAQTGLSIEETTAALTAFASAGLLGSDAGTSLKTMLQRLTPQSKEAADLMKELNISAYTAGGSFVGLDKFAGNLKDSLKNLTPEQRNAALATIFGSDAVRAASILYKEGAEGIQRWTTEVNQTGFASQQAAKLTNNLKGDLERLGGSFDTVLIQGGSGANGALRGLVQTAEKAVNIFGQIPGPILAGAAAFGALALAGPKIGRLATAGFRPLTEAAGRFRQEMELQKALAAGQTRVYDGLGEAFQRSGEKAERGAGRFRAAGAAIGGLKGIASGVIGILGGPWGIALTAATIGVTAFATAQANAQQAGQEFSDTLDAQTGALTEASKAFVGKKLTSDISGEDLKTLQQLGINIGDVTEKVLTGGQPLQDYMNMLKDRANVEDQSQLFSALATSMENTNEDVERGRLIWQGFSSTLAAGAGSVNAVERGTSTLENTLSGYGDAAEAAKDPTEEMNTALGEMSGVSKETSDALKTLSDAVALLSGGELAVRAAQRDLAQSLSDVTEKAKGYTDAVKEHGKKSKEAEEADRDWQAAIDGIASSTDVTLQKMIEDNRSQGELKTAYDTGRAAIEKQLEARGLHGKALQDEADKIIGTRDDFNKLLAAYAKNPGQVATTIKVNGTEAAKTKVKELWQVINGQPRVINFTLVFSSNIASAVAGIQGTIGKIGASIFKADGGIVTAYAEGGIPTSSPDVANAHIPHIAPAGSYRVFGEPETKGESYIPLANDWRRPRAKALTQETARRLGGSVTWHAAGSVTDMRWASGGGAWDYDKLAAAFARMQLPNLHITSGKDAEQTAQQVVRLYTFERDRS